MKILSRKSSDAKETSRKEGPRLRAPRRVEITVEREIVSVWVPGRQTGGPADPEAQIQGAEPIPFEKAPKAQKSGYRLSQKSVK